MVGCLAEMSRRFEQQELAIHRLEGSVTQVRFDTPCPH